MRWKLAFLIVLYFLSVAVRIYPAFVSPIPYNYDALLEARAGQFIADHGNLNYPENVTYNNHHTPVTPFLNALLGAISQIVGVPVISFLPFFFPFLVSVGVFGWFLLAKRVTGRDEIAAFTAIMFALSGTYVLHTALIWKQALGLAMMPFALYTYRKRNAVSIFLLALMPLVHHYVALVTYLMVSYEIVYGVYLKHRKHGIYDRIDYLWIVTMAILWAYLGAYYTLRNFDRLNELSPSGSMWLFISLFVLIFILTVRMFAYRYRGIRTRYYFMVFVVPLIIYLTYFFVPIFPHTPTFNEYTLMFTFGYILLLPLVAMGLVMLLLTEHRDKKLYLSTLVAPLHMILFFFLRGLELESYVSISRTFDFTDFSWHTAVSTAAYSRKRSLAIFAAVFVILATTTPLTYFSMQAFGVNSFVYADEYHAAQWIRENLGNVSIDSDERIGHVARNSFDINSGYMLPYELEKDIKPMSRYWLVSETWKQGAQMRPMPPIKVDVNTLLEENSVVFSSGRTYVVINGTA